MEISESQAKKYGQKAVPDFASGDFSDSLAEGLVELGGVLAVNPAVKSAQSVLDSVDKYVRDKTTIGKVNVTQLLPFDPSTLFPTYQRQGSMNFDSEYDNSIEASSSSPVKAEAKIEFADTNDIIQNPNGVADAAAKAYWENIKKIKRAALISNGNELLKKATNYWMMKQDNIPSDIAATIESSVVNTPFAVTRKVDAQDPNDVFKVEDLVTPNSNYVRAEANARQVTGVSLGMFSTISNQAEREEFANLIDRRLLPEITREYNNRVRASTVMYFDPVQRANVRAYGEVSNFFDIFTQKDPRTGKQYSTSLTQNELFGADGQWNMLQGAMLDVVQRSKSNPLLSANLRSNLDKFEQNIYSDNKLAGLLGAFGKSMSSPVAMVTQGSKVKSGTILPGNLLPVVNVGTKTLSDDLRAKGFVRYANSLEGGVFRAGVRVSEPRFFDKVTYGIERFQTLPSANQLLTIPMVVLGDPGGFANLANAFGGLTGVAPLQGRGINVLGAFGGVNAKTLSLNGGASHRSKFLNWAYDGKAGNQYGGPQFLISDQGNLAQRMSYYGYVFHPVNIVKGFLNGSLFTNMIHISSGHGAMYRDKSIAKLFRTDDLGSLFLPGAAQTFLRGKSFGSLLQNPNDPTSKQGIQYLRAYLNTRFNRLTNKNSLEAKNLQRAANVIKWTERLRNPAYRKLVNAFETVHKVIGLPAALKKKAVNVIKKQLWTWTLKIAGKLGIRAAIEGGAAFLSGGVSLIITGTYEFLNLISFGTLDKIVFGTIKLTFRVIVAIFVAIVVGIIFLGSVTIVPAMNLAEYAKMGVFEGGFLWPPDPEYSPVLASAEGPPEGVGVQTPLIDLAGADGIDVSHHQGNIKWDLVKTSKIEFAIIKATEGSTYVDPQFKKNWVESKKNGIVRSAYHYFCPNIDGTAQAENFLNTVSKAGGTPDFLLSVDVEVATSQKAAESVCYNGASKEKGTANLKKMLDRLELKTGTKPIIYTSAAMWSAVTTQPSWAGDYPLWVASWNDTAPGPLPKGWTDWVVWQYSSNGRINGISGNVDMDKWSSNGGESGLYASGVGSGVGELPPIDWSKYDSLSSNSCPVQRQGGTSVTRCTQGPNGTESHGGARCQSGPCNYAVDIGPGPGSAQVVAPKAGRVSSISIKCSSGGTVSGVKITSSDGSEYRFLHVVPNPSVLGTTVLQGRVIAAMIEGPSPCSSGSHVHFEYWIKGVLDSRPDAAYAAMCGLAGDGLKCR
ncbi:hypothetical protein IT418_04360 [bacterium]|nr:hypothetical protein [bacterium]